MKTLKYAWRFTEAITKYTIMETFNTLKLTNLNHDDIEKIVRDIVK